MAPQPIPQPEDLPDAAPREGGGVMSTWRFRLAVLMHDRAVFRLAAALLRDSREAEDVTQEVFLSYWQHGENVEKPREWLLRVARNACLSRFRRTGRVVVQDPEELPERSANRAIRRGTTSTPSSPASCASSSTHCRSRSAACS